MNTGPFNGSAAQRMRTKGSLRSAAIYLADRHNTRVAMELLAIDAADYWAIRILEALLESGRLGLCRLPLFHNFHRMFK